MQQAQDDDLAPRDLIERAERWLAEDPDPDTRDELAKLIDGASAGGEPAAELAARFAGRLAIWPARRRGGLGAGARGRKR
ncbi:hypothetical protein ACFW15_29725, partial [Streptomyces sp. NPDC058953]